MITFGIIGTSTISHNFVAHAHASGQWALRAIYSRDESKAREFGKKHVLSLFPALYTSIEDLARDEHIQAVYIASPNHLHFFQAKTCLKAGRHVILEKPATSTSAELDTLFKIAKANNVFLIEANRHLQEVNFKVLKENLNRLGTVYGASFTYASYSSRYSNVLAGETPNIFSLDFSGGSLVDIGVYCIAAAIALFGAPKAATYKPVIVATGADGGGPILLEYEDFGVAIQQSKCYTSEAPSEVYGEKGTLRINGVTDIVEVEFVDAKTKEVVKLGKEKCHLNLMEECLEFARIIQNGDKEEAEKLEKLSREVIEVTEKLRRDNGIVFAVER
jgi:predicted dehydrogenase